MNLANLKNFNYDSDSVDAKIPEDKFKEEYNFEFGFCTGNIIFRIFCAEKKLMTKTTRW